MSELSETHTPAGAHGSVHETTMGVDSRKLGIWAFLGSECLFFAALITTYLVYKPVNFQSESYQDPKEFLGIGLTSLLAAILLASSLTMVLALAAVRRNDQKLFRIWHLSTAFLGLCFIGGQVYEFAKLYSEEVTLSSSMFGTTFFVLTGFHGTHVFIGVIWLVAVFLRSLRHPYSAHDYMDVELAGLYWHFVDLVWVVIFTLIYLLPD